MSWAEEKTLEKYIFPNVENISRNAYVNNKNISTTENWYTLISLNEINNKILAIDSYSGMTFYTSVTVSQTSAKDVLTGKLRIKVNDTVIKTFEDTRNVGYTVTGEHSISFALPKFVLLFDDKYFSTENYYSSRTSFNTFLKNNRLLGWYRDWGIVYQFANEFENIETVKLEACLQVKQNMYGLDFDKWNNGSYKLSFIMKD